jgi:acetyltransferase-like isoleucine patch superfamily enzyme
VILPGTVVGAGTTLGALSSPVMGSSLKPGMVYMGTPALPIMRAAPSPGGGETPEGLALRMLVAAFPAIQLAASLISTTAALAPAALAVYALSDAATSALVSAAVVTGISATGLGVVGAAAKKLLVGTLKPATGIKKYSAQNLGRMLAWVIEMRSDELFGNAVRGSSWWNDVLRSRGLSIGEDVYVDTLWAGDYELVTLGDGAVVDRGATLFAHLGMYKEGELSMLQAPVVVGGVVGARAAILPGYSLVAGNVLAPGALGMKMSF